MKDKTKYNKILEEIYLSSEAGLQGINDLIGKVQDVKFKTMLVEMKGDYQDTNEIISKYLEEENYIAKEISTPVKLQMWATTELKTINNSDISNIASMLIDGENMGIKNTTKLLNENKDMPKEVKKILENYLKIQESHIEKIKKYL